MSTDNIKTHREATKVAVHESPDMDSPVVEFKPLSELPEWVAHEYYNGNIWGVHYDDNGDLVAQLQTGEIKNIEL